MADVFLSYSSKDRAAAIRVQQELSRHNIDVFWDQETPPGTDWDTWARGKLAESKVAIVLWSKISVASDSVRHEAMLARKAGKLLPAVIDDLTPEDLPMGLYMVQSVVMTDWQDARSKGLELLTAEVEARLGRGGAVARVQRVAAQIRRASQLPVFFGIVAIIAATAGTAFLLFQQNKTASAIPAAPALEAFAKRLAGHWQVADGQACADGMEIQLKGGQLVFAESGGKGRFVHEIEYDTIREIRTRVIAPAFARNEAYVLAPEFVGTSDPRNFNLVVKSAGGEAETWSPCEP